MPSNFSGQTTAQAATWTAAVTAATTEAGTFVAGGTVKVTRLECVPTPNNQWLATVYWTKP